MHLNNIRKKFISKKEFSSGLSCLASMIKYYDGDKIHAYQMGLLRKRNLVSCKTVLQFCSAARVLEFSGDRYEANMDELCSAEFPIIIPVTPEQDKLEFIICYGYKTRFIVGDPIVGIIEYTDAEMSSVWQNEFIKIVPSSIFKTTKQINREKLKLLKAHAEIDFKGYLTALSTLVLSLVIGILSLHYFSQPDLMSFADSPKKWNFFLCLIIIALLSAYVFKRLVNKSILRLSNNVIDSLKKILITKSNSDWAFNVFNVDYMINDIRQLQFDISTFLLYILIKLPLSIATSFYIYQLNHVMFYVLVVFSTFYISITIWKSKKLEDLSLIKSRFYFLSSRLRQGLQDLKILKSFTPSKSILTNVNSHITDQQSQKSVFNEYLLNKELHTILFFLGFAICFQLQVLDILNFKAYLACVFSLLIVLESSHVIIKFFSINDYLERLYSSLHDNTQLNINYTTPKKIEFVSINIRDGIFAFPEQKIIFKDLNLSFKRNTLTLVRGKSSSGKTTLIEILIGNLKLNYGNIFLNDAGELYDSDNVETSVVPATKEFVSGNIIYNIGFTNSFESVAAIIQFCIKLGFHNFFTSLNDGYLTQLTEKNNFHVPGSIQTLILFARALYQKPQILIVESIVYIGLGEIEQIINNLFKSLKKEMCIIVFTSENYSIDFVECEYKLENKTATKSM